MRWFCRNPVGFVKAIIVQDVYLRSWCSEGSSFDDVRMVRVGKIFSPELKDAVPILGDRIWWLRLLGRFRGDVQKLAH